MSGSPDGVRVSVIDVGKGDCILVQVANVAMLIDTGYEETADKVVSYLQAQGVSSLDCMIVTHYDKDHIGGIRAIGQAFPPRIIYMPGYVGGDKQYQSAQAAVALLGAATQPVTQKVAFDLGGAHLNILPTTLTYDPHASGSEGNDNDLSLVVTLAFESDSYLFAGDLEEEGIAAYLKTDQGAFDVLKVPHHGVKKSNMDELLAAVQPKIALVTDDAHDSADKKTLKQLHKAGADVYCTGECGTILVASTGAGTYSVSHR